MKETGILLPVSSLPSQTGVGELGTYAYEWLDILADAGVTIWQILPLNPVGYGNSPYQPYSSFAGDDSYISLEELAGEGLIQTPVAEFQSRSERVDYSAVRSFKEPYLREAFGSFQPSADYEKFIEQSWVRPYGVFRTWQEENRGKCWNEWPKEQMYWPEKQEMDLAPYEAEIRYQMFLQYCFYRQWLKVKAYAKEKKIKIMGDVPFYVGVDSVDVWMGKENFLLDAQGRPAFVAGVPPDYFSSTGQRWGNPIYDWEHMKKNHYQFWVERIGYSQTLFDILRIDHFRAFDTYWKIPVSCPTAIEGQWVEAPGYEVLDTLQSQIPNLALVAEDLGMLRPEVARLKDHYHLKGMKILEFTLNTDGKYARDDFTDVENMVIYTGTHDNTPIRQWYQELTKPGRRKIRRWLKRTGYGNGPVTERLLRYTLDSPARYAIIPAADITGEGASARLNTPGTIGSPNWEWKLVNFEKTKKALKKYKGAIEARKTLRCIY